MVFQQGVQYVQTPVAQPMPGQQIIIQSPPQQIVPGAPGAPQAVFVDQGAPGGPGVPMMQPGMVQPMVVQQQPGMMQQQPGMMQQQPGMIQQPGACKVKHIPLAKARVLYLGSAVPMETAVGLEALQAPLRERYKTGMGEVSGIDAWLTVYSSGLQMKYVTKDGGDASTVWFPIQTLHVCAAVKALDLTLANGDRQTKFVALDSEYGRKSTHPPIFAAIMRRTTGRKILEAHVFVAKSNQAGMALVQSATHAYEHKEGWTDDEPEDAPTSNGSDMRLLAAPVEEERSAPPEFYKAPPKQGYFYTPNKDLVKNYNIHGSDQGPQMAYPGPYDPIPYDPYDPYLALPAIPGEAPYPYLPYPGGPPPLEYFDDWGAFNSPVSIFGAPPEDYYYPPEIMYGDGGERKKKKKHKHKHHHHCDEERDPIFNRLEYYPDKYYKEAREKGGPAPDRRPYKVEYFDDEAPPRRGGGKDRVHVDREYDRRGGRDRFPEGRRRGDYYQDDLMFYAPAYLDRGDVFYDGRRGGRGGRYYDDYDDLADRFGRF